MHSTYGAVHIANLSKYSKYNILYSACSFTLLCYIEFEPNLSFYDYNSRHLSRMSNHLRSP